MSTLAVRCFAAHEWKTYKALRLGALADSPDAFGSTLADERDRGDAEWSMRLKSAADQSSNIAFLAEVDGEPVGLAWGRIEPSNPEVANLYQFWVAPGRRRLGAGRMLVDAVISWARSRRARFLDLAVTCGDSPATRLYARAGFKPVGEPQPFRHGQQMLESRPMRLEL